VRELTHAIGQWSELKNTQFLDGGQVFNIQSTRFLQPLHIFLTTFMVVISYTIIPTYKYSFIFPCFLTPYHFLSLYFSSFFFSFNSLLGAKVIRLLRGKIVSSRLGEVINPWDKIKFTSFYPKNFLPGVKRIFLGYKKNQI